MIETKERHGHDVSHFARFHKKSGSGPAWLQSLRKSAFDRFTGLGFPTTRDEDWKYTNVGPIAKTVFAIGPRPSPEELKQLDLPGAGGRNRLVFVNGVFSEDLSALSQLPSGISVVTLSEAAAGSNDLLESHLARHARHDDHAFVALNTALFEDGALIEIARGAIIEEPLHLLFVTLPGAEPVISNPRNLIVARRGSQAAIVEEYLSAADGLHFTNAVTEIVAEEGSVVDHYKLQMESEQAWHVATVQGFQERSSTLNSFNVTFGGLLVRNDVNSVLDAEGAECALNGLSAAAGRQHIDNHTALDHAKPNCNSRELYKGIWDGRSAGVFNGKILVRKDAQKTNAIQSNKNLLLSGDAAINTKPQLEIYADDVRCTHGATVGQLDQEAMFYMQSRGIERAAARDLLTYAFAADVFDRMKLESLRVRLEEVLYRKLSANRQE